MELLRLSGFNIEASNERVTGGEPVADLEVRAAIPGGALKIDAGQAAEMIDELLVLAVAATQLQGESRITGAAELHVKESDRIAAMAEGTSSDGC